MKSSKKNHRGVSTAIMSFIISTVVLVIFTFIFLNIASSMYTASAGYRSVVKYSHVQQMHQIVLNKTTDYIYLINVGSSDIIVDQIVIRTYVGGIEVRKPLDICEANTIPALGQIKCTSYYDYVAVITVDGVVIYPQVPTIRAHAVRANATYMVPITFSLGEIAELQQGFNASIELIAKPYPRESAQVNYTGILSTNIPILQQEFRNISVLTNITGVSFGVVIVGYDPSWVLEKINKPSEDIPPRFSIMILAPRFTTGERIRIGSSEYSLVGNGTRIFISNFTGIVQIKRDNTTIACSSTTTGICHSGLLPAVGFWYYGSTDSTLNLRLYINGTAVYVAYYTRMPTTYSPSGRTSYLPYLFIGDVDGNGLNDLVFITEDAYYGSSSVNNDLYSSVNLNDWSTTPLILRLLQVGYSLGSIDGSIDGSRYAGVALYMNIFFHDNSHPDENQLGDNDRTDWVLRVLLIDEYGNEYVVREYRYQEICNYHKTRVVDFRRDNYFAKLSQSLYISFPTAGKYWIALAIQDPYGQGPQNDADITIGVEFIGILPFYRY